MRDCFVWVSWLEWMLVLAAVHGVIARTYNFCVEFGKARLPSVVKEEHSVDHFAVELSIIGGRGRSMFPDRKIDVALLPSVVLGISLSTGRRLGRNA